MKKKLVLFCAFFVLIVILGFVSAATPKKSVKLKNASVGETRVVPCDGTLPLNAISNSGTTYVQTLNPYGIRQPKTLPWGYGLNGNSSCKFRCNTGFIWRNGQCIPSNTRIQDCSGLLPENSSSFTGSTSFIQTYSNGKWTPNADVSSKYRRHRFINFGNDSQLCAFICSEGYSYAQKTQNGKRIDYCVQSTGSLLLETRSKICYGNLPSNSTSVFENVYVDSYYCVGTKGCQFWRVWNDGDPIYPCSYQCNEGYGFANGGCTPQRFQACAGSVPANAISNASATGFIQQLRSGIWQPRIDSNVAYKWRYSPNPSLCTFKCNVGFSWKNGQCVTP